VTTEIAPPDLLESAAEEFRETEIIPVVVAGPTRPSMPPEPEDVPRPLHVRTLDENLSLAASLVAALAAVWLMYFKLLALSGLLGFAVCWWLAFLGIYATVSAVSNPRPVVVDRLSSATVLGGALAVGGALASTAVFIYAKGWPAYTHLNFFTQDMAGVRPTSPLIDGGVKHAVVGSGIQIGIATAISMPLGIGTAVYMTEVGGRLSKTVRTVVEAMTALPDILAGLFVYVVLIIGFHWERSGFAVSLALAVTMIPIVARSAEVVLRIVPGGLREAGLALGASQWQTVRRVVLPTAKAGLATSMILGIARIAGETAPLLIVSGISTFFNSNPFHQPMNSLPLFIFSAVRSGQSLYITRGYGAASVLLTLVLVLFVTTRFLARDKVHGR
jgi:phosphate transport system permease protein